MILYQETNNFLFIFVNNLIIRDGWSKLYKKIQVLKGVKVI